MDGYETMKYVGDTRTEKQARHVKKDKEVLSRECYQAMKVKNKDKTSLKRDESEGLKEGLIPEWD